MLLFIPLFGNLWLGIRDIGVRFGKKKEEGSVTPSSTEPQTKTPTQEEIRAWNATVMGVKDATDPQKVADAFGKKTPLEFLGYLKGISSLKELQLFCENCVLKGWDCSMGTDGTLNPNEIWRFIKAFRFEIACRAKAGNKEALEIAEAWRIRNDRVKEILLPLILGL